MAETQGTTGRELPALDTCAQCGRTLSSDERIAAGDRMFCPACYASLRAELEQAAAAMSSGIHYPNAVAGALLGSAIGALAWWGFTVLTHLAFGLFAVAIGYLTGWGCVRFAGGKRSAGLQAVSVVVALAGYATATYLVNMTFLNRALAERGAERGGTFHVGFPPESAALFLRLVTANFGIMDLVFLAIVVYEAWKIPRPLRLPRAAR